MKSEIDEPQPEIDGSQPKTSKNITHKPWMRDHNCRRIDWDHSNIIDNTNNVIKAHKKKNYTEDEIKQLWKRQVDEIDKTIILKQKKQVFRGMNLDFFNSLKGLLKPKCLDCDTSIKYHIREGNVPTAIVHKDCEVPELGTGTNYLSWSDNYRICVKYALTAFNFKTKTKYAPEIGVLMLTDTVNKEDYNWFYPAGNRSWAEIVSTDEEKAIDKAYKKPMIMLADWSSHDGEYLLKTDKPVKLDDPSFRYLYIRSILIPIGYQSETVGLPKLKNFINQLKIDSGFIYQFYNPEFKGTFGLTFYTTLEAAQSCKSVPRFIISLPLPIKKVLDERTSTILSPKAYDSESSDNEIDFHGFSKKTRKRKTKKRKTRRKKTRRS